MRAFEVAARRGSFVAAGEELGVSSAAVSQQVKSLESTLNKTLFLRQGNRITLTDAGRALYPRLETVFADLVSLTRDLRDGVHPSRLAVSALPSLAELWLVPALAVYPDRHKIDLRIEADPIDFARSGIDLRITYGAHYYPDHHVGTLFRDQFVAVASAGFVASNGSDARSFADAHLIHTDWGRDHIHQPDWGKWFKAAGQMRVVDLAAGLRTDRTLVAVLAAIEGAGIALVPSRLAQNEIGKGTLVQVGQTGVGLSSDYTYVHPFANSRRRTLKNLCIYLKS
ncbi:MAG: LysR family transcriptional regulator, partial [Albidovulum sp.]